MIEYEIYLKSFTTKPGYGVGINKTALMMKKAFDKPVSKQSKVLPLMREVSVSGKKVSQLIRYKILMISSRTPWKWDYDIRECVNLKPIPTIHLEIMPNQNDDYLCYNCMNYQHKRCKRKLMQDSYHTEPCNCKKCWNEQKRKKIDKEN